MKKVLIAVLSVMGVSVTLSVAGLSQQAYAATITVTTNVANGTGGPDCSLLDAFEAANTNAVSGGCPAGEAAPTVDTIVLTNGTYDFQAAELPVNALESVKIKGQSRAGTILTNGRLLINQYESLETSDLSLVHFDIDAVWQGTATGNDYAIHDVSLASSELCLRPSISSQMNEVPLDASFTDITGTVASGGGDGSTINILSAGDTHVNNVTMNGAGATFTGNDEFGDSVRPQAIWHVSRGDDRLYIKDSLIMNYPTVLKNDECFALQPWSVYMDNVFAKDISGTAIRNECGHVVINRSTFANVAGPLIRGEMSGSSYNDGYTDIEIYSSTFDGVQGDQDCPYVLCFQLRYSGEEPKGDNRIRIKQSTFSESNAPSIFGYEEVPLQDSSVLGINDVDFDQVILQNNAFGSDVDPAFLVATQTTVSGNLSIGQASSGIRNVSTLGLGPLQDNGGTATGENGTGGNPLTMLPLASSPLINGANMSAGIESDQRGSARNAMARYDVGAVEVTVAEYVAMGGVLDDESSAPGAPNSGVASRLDIATLGSVTAVFIVLATGGLVAARSAKRFF